MASLAERDRRTRRLIDQGGLVDKSGLVEAIGERDGDMDEDALLGALVEASERVREDAAVAAQWRRRGRAAFDADVAKPQSASGRRHPDGLADAGAAAIARRIQARLLIEQGALIDKAGLVAAIGEREGELDVEAVFGQLLESAERVREDRDLVATWRGLGRAKFAADKAQKEAAPGDLGSAGAVS